MKRIVNVHEAKTRLSALMAAVEAGERVVIARDGKPAVELVRHREEAIDRTPGTLAADPAWADWKYDPAVFAKGAALGGRVATGSVYSFAVQTINTARPHGWGL